MGHKRQPSLRNLAPKLLQIGTLLGLSESEMIDRLGSPLGLNESDIRSYERSRHEPPLVVLLRYARLMSVPLDILADDELMMPERLSIQAAPQEGVCPYCKSSEKQVKAGLNHTGSQRYLCQLCRRRYTHHHKSVGHPEELRQKAVLLHQEGKRPWSISKEIGVSHQTVINWLHTYYSGGIAVGRRRSRQH